MSNLEMQLRRELRNSANKRSVSPKGFQRSKQENTRTRVLASAMRRAACGVTGVDVSIGDCFVFKNIRSCYVHLRASSIDYKITKDFK